MYYGIVTIQRELVLGLLHHLLKVIHHSVRSSTAVEEMRILFNRSLNHEHEGIVEEPP